MDPHAAGVGPPACRQAACGAWCGPTLIVGWPLAARLRAASAAQRSSRAAPHPGRAPRPGGSGACTGSRGVVLQIAALQALDSLAGGFVVQSPARLLVPPPLRAGPGGPGPTLLRHAACCRRLSFLAAARLAERCRPAAHDGLHATSSRTCSWPLVPLVDAVASRGRGDCCSARHVLSQMDVPTRQAYTMALVAPDERAAAAGLTAASAGCAGDLARAHRDCAGPRRHRPPVPARGRAEDRVRPRPVLLSSGRRAACRRRRPPSHFAARPSRGASARRARSTCAPTPSPGPRPAMRRAMAEAEVGDDVYAEDPTVNRLQEAAARAARLRGRALGALRA